MHIFKKLVCKHEYEYMGYCMLDFGMRKLLRYKCKKCGKIRQRVI